MKIIMAAFVFIVVVIQCHGQKNDTIVCTNGRKILCNIKGTNDFNVVYLITIDGIAKKRKIDIGEVSRLIYFKETPEANKDIKTAPKTLSNNVIRDTLKYLTQEYEKLQKNYTELLNNSNYNMENARIAGNCFTTAGAASIASILTGAVATFLILNGANEKDNKNMTTAYVFAGLSAICSIIVPFELMSGGSYIKNTR
jgi:hypothetical protein